MVRCPTSTPATSVIALRGPGEPSSGTPNSLARALGDWVDNLFKKNRGTLGGGWNFPFSYPWVTALQMVIVATLAAIVAGLYPARRAARLDVVEALAYE